MAEDLELKLFAMMRETLPGLRKVFAITNPTNPSHPVMLDLLKQQAAKDGIALDVAKVSAPADLEALYVQMAQQRPDAAFVLSDNSVLALSDSIVARALARHLASFGTLVDSFAREGGLFAYSRDPRESFRGVARLLKKILDGASPAELPFEQPTKFNLFINLRTAKKLGIEIPAALLCDRRRGDRVGIALLRRKGLHLARRDILHRDSNSVANGVKRKSRGMARPVVFDPKADFFARNRQPINNFGVLI